MGSPSAVPTYCQTCPAPGKSCSSPDAPVSPLPHAVTRVEEGATCGGGAGRPSGEQPDVCPGHPGRRARPRSQETDQLLARPARPRPPHVQAASPPLAPLRGAHPPAPTAGVLTCQPPLWGAHLPASTVGCSPAGPHCPQEGPCPPQRPPGWSLGATAVKTKPTKGPWNLCACETCHGANHGRSGSTSSGVRCRGTEVWSWEPV